MGHRSVSLSERTLRPDDETAPEGDSSPDPQAGRGPAWLRTRRGQISLVAALVALCVVLGVVAWRVMRDDIPPITQAQIAQTVQEGIEKARQDEANAPPRASAVYQAILPSLVTVTTRDGSLGTGVVIKADGTVLTALHVVADGSVISLRFADNTEVRGTVVEKQPEDDIATILPDDLPQVVVPAVIGGGAQVGSDVFAVGNPLGLVDSLTAGVVSGLDRSTSVEDGAKLDGLIQFDAAVNPGNSGGPLLDRDAQVIGIVTGLANPAEQPFFIGIGFAVPIETAGGGAGGPRK